MDDETEEFIRSMGAEGFSHDPGVESEIQAALVEPSY